MIHATQIAGSADLNGFKSIDTQAYLKEVSSTTNDLSKRFNQHVQRFDTIFKGVFCNSPKTPVKEKYLEKLRIELRQEQQLYLNAIKDGKLFDDAKKIFLRIKDLQVMVDVCMQQALG